VRARAQAKLAEIEGRIAGLDRMRDSLARLAASCPSEAPVDDCPILAALEGESGPG
jgi:MerR family copper efflux transcriptional regulator